MNRPRTGWDVGVRPVGQRESREVPATKSLELEGGGGGGGAPGGDSSGGGVEAERKRPRWW
jgi:hypothetical protein